MFLTPDDPTAQFDNWVFRVPRGDGVMSLVMGALAPLANAGQWEEKGNMTRLDSASMFAGVLYSRRKLVTVGTIVHTVWETAPDGYLRMDGASHLRVDYPELYALIPLAWQDSPDQFTLPNFDTVHVISDGEIVVGGEVLADLEIGQRGGEWTHTLQDVNLPNHVITIPDHIHGTAPHTHLDAGHTHLDGIAVPSLAGIGVDVPIPAAIPGGGVTTVGFASIQPASVEIISQGLQGEWFQETVQPVLWANPFIALRFFIIAK